VALPLILPRGIGVEEARLIKAFREVTSSPRLGRRPQPDTSAMDVALARSLAESAG
jgi:hypothetical protein